MCTCQPEIGYICGAHDKRAEERRRREQAIVLNQIKCPQCREQALRKFSAADQ